MVLKLSYTLLILIWLCQWKEGVSELSSLLQPNIPSSSNNQFKESVIVGIPIPVEKSESLKNAAKLNSAVNLNNVFFLVRNPSQFPSAIEKLVIRIQNYFSNFNSLQSLTDRPRPTYNATDTSGTGTDINSQINNNNILGSPISESNDSSPSLRFNHLQDNQNIDRVDQEPDPVYTITLGPNIVYEPPQSYYPAPANTYLPPVEDSHLEAYYRGGSYHAPASAYIAPSSTLLPPTDSAPNQGQHPSGGYYYPLPCTTTTTNSPYPGPCVPQIDQPSTTEATYLPPYEPEIEVQGPFLIDPPKTPPSYPNSQESNAYPAQTSPCSQSTTPAQAAANGCNPPTTTSEPTTTPEPTTTTTTAPCYTTTEKSTTTTLAPCSTTTTAAPTTTSVRPCHTTTTAAPTTTTTTTEKPTTTTTTNTKVPCYSTTTATPTTKLPCQTTTEKPTTTTTKQPCQHSTTTSSTTPPCQHAKPSVTEPTWTYLPPQKPTKSPNAPVTSRKPLYYLPPQDNTYQAANQINNNYYRPLFRSHPKFLYRLKRLFGLV